MRIEITNRDQNFPIRITDTWGDQIIMALDEAKGLLKELGKAVETFDKKPKVSEPEKKVVHFEDDYNRTTKVVKITVEQDKLLDWLCDQDFIDPNVNVVKSFPEAEDLT